MRKNRWLCLQWHIHHLHRHRTDRSLRRCLPKNNHSSIRPSPRYCPFHRLAVLSTMEKIRRLTAYYRAQRGKNTFKIWRMVMRDTFWNFPEAERTFRVTDVCASVNTWDEMLASKSPKGTWKSIQQIELSTHNQAQSAAAYQYAWIHAPPWQMKMMACKCKIWQSTVVQGRWSYHVNSASTRSHSPRYNLLRHSFLQSCQLIQRAAATWPSALTAYAWRPAAWVRQKYYFNLNLHLWYS